MLDIEQSILLVIDVQDKFARMMHDKHYLHYMVCMIKVARLLEIPILVTEQAPGKIGKTIEEIYSVVQSFHIIPKESFSCYGEPVFVKSLESLKRRQIMITGIEAHGCIWQSVHDLLLNKYEVFAVVDAISAHAALNKDIALRRCERQGAVLTTVEMAATELMRTAGHPQFKEVMEILKECFRV